MSVTELIDLLAVKTQSLFSALSGRKNEVSMQRHMKELETIQKLVERKKSQELNAR